MAMRKGRMQVGDHSALRRRQVERNRQQEEVNENVDPLPVRPATPRLRLIESSEDDDAVFDMNGNRVYQQEDGTWR